METLDTPPVPNSPQMAGCQQEPCSALRWPECDNCGNPAKWRGSHPEAGGVAVCEDCVTGQGFKHLRSIAEMLKRERPVCRACGGRLKRGRVLIPGIYGSEDFGGDFGQHGTTMSEGPATKGPVDCLKCEKCGHSFLPQNVNVEASADEKTPTKKSNV